MCVTMETEMRFGPRRFKHIQILTIWDVLMHSGKLGLAMLPGHRHKLKMVQNG
jgi:hypothetical protein